MASSNSADREVFGAYVSDDSTSQMLVPIIQQLGWKPESVFKGGIAAAVRSHGAMKSPEFLLVDVSESVNPRSDINELAEVCEPGTVVVVIGTTNDVTFYRELIQSGIQDYLVKPLTPEILGEAIYSAEAALRAGDIDSGSEVPLDENKCIMFVGARGGVGSSTLAANAAWYYAQDKSKTVALLDLDLQFGVDAMQFDMEPGRGLADALDNPNRVDSLFIERAVVKPLENLSILGSESPLGDPVMVDPTAINHLIDILKDSYDTVIIDVPRSMLAYQPAIFSAGTDVVLTSDLTLTSARDIIRLLAHVGNVAPNARTHIVTNKTLTGPLNEVEPSDFEASVEHRIDVSLPVDTKTATLAAKKGEVLLNSFGTSKLGSGIKGLLDTIAGGAVTGESGNKGLLGKLLGKG